jgi:hypothetical protein
MARATRGQFKLRQADGNPPIHGEGPAVQEGERPSMSIHPGPLATLLRLTLLCLLLVCGKSSAGNLFEWVDSSGTTHFSDRAPIGLPFSEKTASPATRTARTDNEAGIRKAERALLQNAQRHDLEIEHARQAAALRTEQHKSRCRQARSRYQEAIHRPGSAGRGDYKAFRNRMKEVCD